MVGAGVNPRPFVYAAYVDAIKALLMLTQRQVRPQSRSRRLFPKDDTIGMITTRKRKYTYK